MILISSGRITSPVTNLDITLPAGYDYFELKLIGFKQASADSFYVVTLQGLFSQDGGSSFLSDYARRHVDNTGAFDYNDSGTALILGQIFSEIFDAGEGSIDAKGNSVSIFGIAPGSAGAIPLIEGNIRSADNDPNNSFGTTKVLWNDCGGTSLTAGRINLLRLRYDPDDNATISTGSWFLRGEVTPA